MTEPLLVGVPADYRPFAFRSSSGALVGLDVELVEALCSRTGLKPEWRLVPWGRLEAAIDAGEIDLAAGGVTVSPERLARCSFLPSHLSFWKTGLVRRRDLARFRTPLDLNVPGIRVLKNPGGTNERWVDAHLDRASVLLWNENEEIPGRVAAGFADLMVTDVIEARWYADRNPLLAVLPLHLTDLQQKALMLAQGSRFSKALHEAFENLHASGELSRLLAHWNLS